MGFLSTIPSERQREVAAAAAGAAFDADAALAAAAATCIGYVDVGLDSSWQAADRTTAADGDGDPVNALTPTTATGFTWLFNGSGQNLIDWHDTGLTGIDAPVLEMGQATAFGPTDDGSALKPIAFVTAEKWWLMIEIQPQTGTHATALNIFKESSASQLSLELIATSDTGKYTLQVAMDLANATLDRTTIVKERAHGTTTVLWVFFDGTDLHWEFDGEEPQTSAAFAGTLDPVGATNAWWCLGSGGLTGDTLWRRFGMGGVAADNAVQLQILKDWMTAVEQKLAA